MMEKALSKRLIAIGDIHGCATALQTLIDSIGPTTDDTVICLGDVVDRGPDSRRAIEMLMELQDQCDFKLIRGNHEEMMLAVLQGEPPHEWLRHGGVQTLESYGFVGDLSVVPDRHVEFLNAAFPLLEFSDHFFTHGNYDPSLPFDEQTPEMLRWTSLIMSTPGPHVSGKKAVLGHTPDKSGEVFDIGHLLCIDTYCYGGGWLTATDVVSGQIWQASEEGALRS